MCGWPFIPSKIRFLIRPTKWKILEIYTHSALSLSSFGPSNIIPTYYSLHLRTISGVKIKIKIILMMQGSLKNSPTSIALLLSSHADNPNSVSPLKKKSPVRESSSRGMSCL